MKRLFRMLLAAIMMVVLCAVPDVAMAEEMPDVETSPSADKGELADIIDCGDGVVIYSYVTEESTGGIQTYASATKTATKYSDVYIGGVYSFTIKQSATFEYNRSDGVAVIRGASGSVSSTSSSSSYYPGSVSTSYASGVPGKVTSSAVVYKRSDGSSYGTYTVYLYVYGDGTYS